MLSYFACMAIVSYFITFLMYVSFETMTAAEICYLYNFFKIMKIIYDNLKLCVSNLRLIVI